MTNKNGGPDRHLSADGLRRPCTAASVDKCRADGEGSIPVPEGLDPKKEEAWAHAMNKLRFEGKVSPESLGKGMDRDELFEFASKNTDRDVLNALSFSEDWYVRLGVASNELALPKTLERMADDKELVIQEAIASNPSSNLDTLRALGKSYERKVRLAVVKNKALFKLYGGEEILAMLGHDRDPEIRQIGERRFRNL